MHLEATSAFRAVSTVPTHAPPLSSPFPVSPGALRPVSLLRQTRSSILTQIIHRGYWQRSVGPAKITASAAINERCLCGRVSHFIARRPSIYSGHSSFNYSHTIRFKDGRV